MGVLAEVITCSINDGQLLIIQCLNARSCQRRYSRSNLDVLHLLDRFHLRQYLNG